MAKKWDYVPTKEELASNPSCMNCRVELPINESRVWCPNASEQGFHCQMRKDFGSIQFTRPWPEHYNVACGQVIRTEHQMKEVFKAKSDEMSERMNFDVNYQVADMSDTKTLGVNEKGLDSTHDARVASGQKESRGKFVF